MAEIWSARLKGVKGFEKPLVIKKILPSYARRRSFIQMFIQEAKLCSGLQHANIVQIYELGEVSGEYYIAMEYVKGWDLLRVLYYASRRRVQMPLNVALYVIREVCRALAYAHSAMGQDGRPLRIVHLDVSPSNILVSEGGAVKLTDFGVARAAIERTSGDVSGTLRGKVAYMSPEQVVGGRVDSRSDLFSAGICLYELLTQKRLFRARTALETLANVRGAEIEPRLARHPEIPEAIQTILRRVLCRSRANRYQTAEEFGADIEAYLFENRIRVGPRDLADWLGTFIATFGDAVASRGDEDSISVGPWESSVRSRAQYAEHADVQDPRGSRYVFRKTNGSGFGPVPYNVVLDLVRRRAVHPDELVSVDGGEWCPVRRVPALSDAMALAFKRTSDPPSEEGLFESDNAIRLLSRLAWQRLTCLLRLERDGVQKDVFLRRGRVYGIVSNRKDELFGLFLLRRGVINPVQLQVAVSQARGQEQPIGTTLVQLGFLDHAAVFRLLEEQLRERFTELLCWTHGRYEVVANDSSSGAAGLIEFDPLPVLVEGVRSNVSSARTLAYFRRLSNPRLHWDSKPPFEPELLRFTPGEFRFVKTLQSGPARTVGQLIHRLARNDEESRRTLLMILYVLHQTGHLRIVEPL